MIKILKIAGSRMLSGVRLLAGGVVLAVFPILAIYFNYSTDCSGYFQGDLYLRDTANMVLAGQDLVGYERLNSSQRDIMKILANNMEPVPKAIALGSSRILQLNSEISGIDSFFNCALTGGDAADVLGTFWLFDREDRLPETVIIGFDPWLLRDGEAAMDTRSDRELYAEFLNTKLGYQMPYTKTDTSEKWNALYSLSYFQNNVSFALRDDTGVERPQPVQGDLYHQTTEVKRGDGSLLYDMNFRSRPQEERNADALYQTANLLRMTDYPALGTEMPQVFDKFFAYAKSRGVNVVIILTPYHPIVYDYAKEHPETFPGFMQTEPAVRALAEKYDIPVYGSYDPHAIEDVTEADFYDGLHCTGEALEKILRGVNLNECKIG